MELAARHNVNISGIDAGRPMIFAHGFGCDQNMWRMVAPAFEDRFKVIQFDLMGAGGSDLTAYDPDRYHTLQGHAEDLVMLAKQLKVRNGVFVGHSVSAMIGIMAARKDPSLFSDLVMVGPSPRYIDDPSTGYVGGFAETQILELLDFLDSNHMGWSQAMAPVIMGNADRPELRDELTNSFCRTDPDVARQFARTTFLSDNRTDLEGFATRTLILQCSDDVIAPRCVGEYVHRALSNSQLVLMAATGHCPNLSAPEETIAAIQAFV